MVLWAPVAFAAFTFAQSAQVNVERDGDRLHVSAPQFHFLTGQPLEQLHDGRSVTYVLTVSLQVQRGQARGAGVSRQVVFSYDLWEERFSVARVDEPNTSASHLTAAAAEAWCMDLLSLPTSAAPADKTFVVKLECSLREEGAPVRRCAGDHDAHRPDRPAQPQGAHDAPALGGLVGPAATRGTEKQDGEVKFRAGGQAALPCRRSSTLAASRRLALSAPSSGGLVEGLPAASYP